VIPDEVDYGAFFDMPGAEVMFARQCQEMRLSNLSDKELLRHIVAGVITAVIECGLVMSDFQTGNVVARYLSDELGYHRRPNC
jgi:hypothetical protein